MKQSARPETVNEFREESLWLGVRDRLVSSAMWSLSLPDRVLMRALSFLSVGSELTPDCPNHRTNNQPRLVLTLDRVLGSLDLVVTNKSRVGIWVAEALVELTDLETDGITYPRPAPAVHKIGLLVAPAETVRISLTNTVYNVAGRPAKIYSCTISTVLGYRVGDDDGERVEQPVSPYYADLIALVPIGLRRAKGSPKPVRSGRLKGASGFQTQGSHVRRSRRMVAESAVVVEGTFGDGRPFSESTYALVLSLHGCLVNMTKPVEIGEALVLRNICTQQEQLCRVVYIGQMHGNRMKVGLGFEAEAPRFWGTAGLPSVGEVAV